MTATLQAGDVLQDSKGWFYRVRSEVNTYDSFSEFDGAATPVVDGDPVSWPVVLLVRDGAAVEGQRASRMALFLNERR